MAGWPAATADAATSFIIGILLAPIQRIGGRNHPPARSRSALSRQEIAPRSRWITRALLGLELRNHLPGIDAAFLVGSRTLAAR